MLIICLILSYVCLIVAFIAASCKDELYEATIKLDIIIFSLQILSALFCLPVTFGSTSEMFCLIILICYTLCGIYSIAIIFDSEGALRFIIAIVIYVGVYNFVVYIIPNINSNGYYVFIFTYLIIIGIKLIFSIIKYSIQNKKYKDKENKKYEFKEKYNELVTEANNKINTSFINQNYEDLWLTNDNAIKYLDKVHSNLVIVNEAINKSIEDKVFYKGVPQYINSSIETLFNKIEEDTKSANNELKILSLGMNGEELVNKIINTHKYIENLPNLIIKDNDGQRVECDNILITDKGIFILEVKNYESSGNFTLKIDTSGKWERIYKSKAYVMDSPVAQNSRHIGIIKNILFDNNISVPVYGIIVISNDTVDIINNSNSIVVRAGSLMDTINNLKGEVLLNIDERKNIYNLFNGMRKEEVKHPFKNYTLYNDYLNDILSLINLNNEYRENVVKLYNEVFPDNK